jgi:hypothetical protein
MAEGLTLAGQQYSVCHSAFASVYHVQQAWWTQCLPGLLESISKVNQQHDWLAGLLLQVAPLPGPTTSLWWLAGATRWRLVPVARAMAAVVLAAGLVATPCC